MKIINWIICVFTTFCTACFWWYVYLAGVVKGDMKAYLWFNKYGEGWIEFIVLSVIILAGIIWSVYLYKDMLKRGIK